MAFSAGIDQRFIAVSWGGVSAQFGWSAGFDATGTFSGTGIFTLEGVVIENYTLSTGAFDLGWGWSTDNIRKFMEDNDIDIPDDNVIELFTSANVTFAPSGPSKAGAPLNSGVTTNKGQWGYTSNTWLPVVGPGETNAFALSVSWYLNIKTGVGSLNFSNPS